jgi:hypothetical protein
MAASLIPYIGPLDPTMGGQVLENMTDLKSDSTEQEAEATGITSAIRSSLPGEAKDKFVSRLAKAATKYGKVFAS